MSRKWDDPSAKGTLNQLLNVVIYQVFRTAPCIFSNLCNHFFELSYLTPEFSTFQPHDVTAPNPLLCSGNTTPKTSSTQQMLPSRCPRLLLQHRPYRFLAAPPRATPQRLPRPRHRPLSTIATLQRKDAAMSSEPPPHEMVVFKGLTSETRNFGEFRKVLHTGLYSQLVAMEIPVRGDIGDEVSGDVELIDIQDGASSVEWLRGTESPFFPWLIHLHHSLYSPFLSSVSPQHPAARPALSNAIPFPPPPPN